MSETSPYQLLGVSEDASFEEIQLARQALVNSASVTEEELEQIEQAYDMILMQRLRLRKEGKIAVPDRIRYAERTVDQEAKEAGRATGPAFTLPSWMQRWVDNPDTQDIVWPAGLLGVLCAWAYFFPAGEDVPSAPIALGLFVSVYFLYRKERRFFRACLLALGSMTIGLVVAQGIVSVLPVPDVGGAILLVIAFSIVWLVTAFLR